MQTTSFGHTISDAQENQSSSDDGITIFLPFDVQGLPSKFFSRNQQFETTSQVNRPLENFPHTSNRSQLPQAVKRMRLLYFFTKFFPCLQKQGTAHNCLFCKYKSAVSCYYCLSIDLLLDRVSFCKRINCFSFVFQLFDFFLVLLSLHCHHCHYL